jgi:recombination protein RecT
LKDGGKQRAIMTVAEIERVRAVSRAKNGPAWSQWWDEMAKKTVIRRLSKYLPSSTDKDEEFHRAVQADDELYKEEPASTPAQDEPAAPARRRTRASAVIDAQAVEIEEPPPPPAPEPEPARASEEMDLI